MVVSFVWFVVVMCVSVLCFFVLIIAGEKSDMEKHQEEMEKCLEGLEEAPESESEESMLSDKGSVFSRALLTRIETPL